MNHFYIAYIGVGVWTIASPWILGLAELNTVVINSVGVGLFLIVMSLWALFGK